VAAVRALVVLVPVALLALAFPVREAGAGDGPSPSASVAASAPRTVVLRPLAPSAVTTVTLGAALPDPVARVEKRQWVYDLRYSGGDLYLLGIHRLELPTPQGTPRVMGRFCLELYEGATLLERARFDFPMLGDGTGIPGSGSVADAGATNTTKGPPPSFAKISSRIGVMFPAIARGTRIDIVDRALDRRWPLPWPPIEMTATGADAAPDAGVSPP
jgi:hypothetical protein